MDERKPRINANEHERKHWDLCHDIVEVFFAVYNELGFGFLEGVYEEALALALAEAGFTVARQVPTPIWFRGRNIGEYKADLIANNAVLLELKSARTLEPAHGAQVLNYLRSTDIEVALLLNFGPHPHFKRFVFENTRKGIRVHSSIRGKKRRSISCRNSLVSHNPLTLEISEKSYEGPTLYRR